MNKLSLNGKWKMRRLDTEQWLEATVPGSVYGDLLNAGQMPDPFFRDNEKDALKLSEYDYEYCRIFHIDSSLYKYDKLFLVCSGLDTLAEISVNGQFLAKTFNMHRKYEFDIKPMLMVGENTISIVFRSPVNYISQKQKESPLWGVDGTIKGYAHIRKAHYMFGWDWGPQLPDMGIWRDICIIGYSSQKFNDILISQSHQKEKVKLDIRIKLDKWALVQSDLRVAIKYPNGEFLVKTMSFMESESTVSMEIENPELWWPNGYGKQPLYEINIELLDNGRQSDFRSYKIGLRTLTVTQKDDQWGRSFAFTVNGVEIFAMGANYIPEDNILSRCSAERTEKLIKSCVEANYNCLRVWGGGYYPDNYFYDLCDKYGIIVWQDLMFACAVYDLSDDFKENIRQEAIDNMRRLRHHASLGLWCGNNEMEWAWVEWNFPQTLKLKADYIKQFEVLLPEIAKSESPDTFYWLASPSSTGSFDRPNDQNYGDMHDWSVWQQRMPFTDYRQRFPRFMSEFGMQSLPSIKTIEAFTLPEDRNIFSYVLESHQKSPSGNEKIMYYLSQYFKFPKSFDFLIYISQLIQAESMRYGVEHWRRNRGRCMGATYWQVNDCWPVVSSSSIDSFGRWKALHYAAKRFFSPVLLSACEQGAHVSLHVTNETMDNVTAKLSWKLCDSSSNVISQSEKSISIPPLSAEKFEDLDFNVFLRSESDLRNHYLEFSLSDGKILSEGTVLFVPAKHFEFKEPGLKTQVEEQQDRYAITVTSEAFAKFIELDLKSADAVFSDNYFDLSAGSIKNIFVMKENISKALSLEEFEEQLTIRSLADSY